MYKVNFIFTNHMHSLGLVKLAKQDTIHQCTNAAKCAQNIYHENKCICFFSHYLKSKNTSWEFGNLFNIPTSYSCVSYLPKTTVPTILYLKSMNHENSLPGYCPQMLRRTNVTVQMISIETLWLKKMWWIFSGISFYRKSHKNIRSSLEKSLKSPF